MYVKRNASSTNGIRQRCSNWLIHHFIKHTAFVCAHSQRSIDKGDHLRIYRVLRRQLTQTIDAEMMMNKLNIEILQRVKVFIRHLLWHMQIVDDDIISSLIGIFEPMMMLYILSLKNERRTNTR